MNLIPHHEHVLASDVVGYLQSYTDEIEDFRQVDQTYLERSYQSVLIHPVPQRSPVEEIVVQSFMAFNNKYFQYDLSGTFEIQLLKYLDGSHYDWHCDYGNSNGPVRKLSMTIQLTHHWEYNGCDVILKDWYNRSHNISKEIGSVTVFDSKVPHKVTPLTNGERIVLVAWAHGPELR